eukprot:3849960-Pyramimonas_sp.AAC.1
MFLVPFTLWGGVAAAGQRPPGLRRRLQQLCPAQRQPRRRTAAGPDAWPCARPAAAGTWPRLACRLTG